MRKLPLIVFILGLVLWLGGDERYFHKSGGTGIVFAFILAPVLGVVLHFVNPDEAQNRVYPGYFKVGRWVLASGIVLGLIAWATSDSSGLGGLGSAFLAYSLIFIGVLLTLAGLAGSRKE